MKNITLLMTLVCAMIWQFAISQSTLKLPVSKSKTVFITFKNYDGAFIENSTVVMKEPGNIGSVKTIAADDLYFDGQAYATYVNDPQNAPAIYSISNNINPLNGVNTFDRILIQRHFLGLETFNLSQKYIAADVDRSGVIDEVDADIVIKVILGTYPEFPNAPSWIFYDKNQEFPSLEGTLTVPLQTEINPFVGNGPFYADFMAVKTGDVDLTSVAHNLTGLEERAPVQFSVEDKTVRSGDIFEVTFQSEKDVLAYQLTLNTNGLDVIDANLPVQNYKLLPKEDRADFWSPALTMLSEENIKHFSVRFKALHDGNISEMIQFGSQITPALAFDEVGNASGVALNFQPDRKTISCICLDPEVSVFAPNPWTSSTNLNFYLPDNGATTIRVADMNGKTVYTKTVDLVKGLQTIQFQQDDFKENGVYLFEINSGAFKKTGKMVKM